MVIVDKVCFMIHLWDKYGEDILVLAVRLLNHRSQKSKFRLAELQVSSLVQALAFVVLVIYIVSSIGT